MDAMRTQPSPEFFLGCINMNVENFNGVSSDGGEDLFSVGFNMGSSSGDPVVPDLFLSLVEVWLFFLTSCSVTFTRADSGVILVIRLLLLATTPGTGLYLIGSGELDPPDGDPLQVPQHSEGGEEGVNLHGDVSVTLLDIGHGFQHGCGVTLGLVGLVGAGQDFTEGGQHPDYVRIIISGRGLIDLDKLHVGVGLDRPRAEAPPDGYCLVQGNRGHVEVGVHLEVQLDLLMIINLVKTTWVYIEASY